MTNCVDKFLAEGTITAEDVSNDPRYKQAAQAYKEVFEAMEFLEAKVKEAQAKFTAVGATDNLNASQSAINTPMDELINDAKARLTPAQVKTIEGFIGKNHFLVTRFVGESFGEVFKDFRRMTESLDSQLNKRAKPHGFFGIKSALKTRAKKMRYYLGL